MPSRRSPTATGSSFAPAVAAADQTRDTNIRGNGQNVPESSDNVGPWRSSKANTNVGENSAGARVKIAYPNTLAAEFKSFALSYWTNTGTAQYHRIFLSDFTFSSFGCG